MPVFFIDKLTEPLSEKILHFALQCNAAEFTVRSLEQGPAPPTELFQKFMLGSRTRELPKKGSKRIFERVPVWAFNNDSAGEVLRLCPGGFHSSPFEWIVYSSSNNISAVVRPGFEETYMLLAQHQWEELIRRGLRLYFWTWDDQDHKREYTSIDLPENRHHKLRVQYPNWNSSDYVRKVKSVDELFKNRYGVQSFPPNYGYPRMHPKAEDNPYILSWWSATHDQLLARHVKRDGWKWWPSYAAISQLTDADAFTKWQIEDPECLNRGASAVLVDFARARAMQTGLLDTIQFPPDTRNCQLCGYKFPPSTHHPNLAKASPLTFLYCWSCITEAFRPGNRLATKDECVAYIRQLTGLLGRIPQSGFGTDWPDFAALDSNNASDILQLLKCKPLLDRIRDHFGSWLALLIEAGVLEDGTRQMPRGTQCLARDGHVCLSLAEKTIDDLLTELQIPHEKEVNYPNSGYRCDFLANGVYVEYFGLSGDPTYDEKSREKLALAQKLGIRVLALYPEDVARYPQLKLKLEHNLTGTL